MRYITITNSNIDIEQKRFLKRLYKRYRKSAEDRGHDFDLSSDDFDGLVLQNCAYCGAGPSNKITSRKGSFLEYNGLDRMDSRSGYSLENVVPCCRFCNSLKGRMSWIYWQDFLNGVVELCGGQRPFPDLPKNSKRPSRSFYRGR